MRQLWAQSCVRGKSRRMSLGSAQRCALLAGARGATALHAAPAPPRCHAVGAQRQPHLRTGDGGSSLSGTSRAGTGRASSCVTSAELPLPEATWLVLSPTMRPRGPRGQLAQLGAGVEAAEKRGPFVPLASWAQRWCRPHMPNILALPSGPRKRHRPRSRALPDTPTAEDLTWRKKADGSHLRN